MCECKKNTRINASIVLDQETEKHFKFKLIKNIFIKK